MMPLVKIFGLELTKPIEYILLYSISIVVLILGLIILRILNKKIRPLQPKEIYKKEQKCISICDDLLKDISNNQSRITIARKTIKLQMDINQLVYASTIVIEDTRNNAFEAVRNSYHNAIKLLDDLAVETVSNEVLNDTLNKVKTELQSSEEATIVIANQFKK